MECSRFVRTISGVMWRIAASHLQLMQKKVVSPIPVGGDAPAARAIPDVPKMERV
jgi:hypothetical protein